MLRLEYRPHSYSECPVSFKGHAGLGAALPGRGHAALPVELLPWALQIPHEGRKGRWPVREACPVISLNHHLKRGHSRGDDCMSLQA